MAKYVVRDDIIHVDRYYKAERYKDILDVIYKSGYYVFLSQFKMHYKNPKIYTDLLENKLIYDRVIDGNNKILMLTPTCMKYLLLRDDERDFSNTPKNKINVIKINKNPSEKQLFTSAYKFELLHDGLKIADKDYLINTFYEKYLEAHNIDYDTISMHDKEIDRIKKMKEDFEKFYKGFEAFLKRIDNKYYDLFNSSMEMIKKDEDNLSKFIYEARFKIDSMIVDFNDRSERFKEEKEKLINSYVYLKAQELKEFVRYHYEQAKILIEFDNFNLKIWIFDTGSNKTPWAYMNYLHKFKQKGMKYKRVDFVIVSYSKDRAYSLRNRFLESIKLRDEADKKMSAWEKEKKLLRRYRKNWKYEPPEIYRKLENIYYQFQFLNNIEIYEKTFYMEKFKMFTVSNDDYIKEKDRITIESIRDYVNRQLP